MTGYNKVILIGNLTRDPEQRTTGSGQGVVALSLAVNRKYSRGDGSKGEEVMFIDAEAWGRTGEVVAQYHRKGDPILLEGRLQLDRWEGKDGGQRTKHKLVVERFEFQGSGKAQGGQGAGGGRPQGGQNGGGGQQGAGDELEGFDEVPF